MPEDGAGRRVFRWLLSALASALLIPQPALLGQAAPGGTTPVAGQVLEGSTREASAPTGEAAPAAGVGTGTNAPTAEKAFQWRVDWRGWDGLHAELSQRTSLKDPLAEVRRATVGTNATRFMHWDEVKLTGKIGGKVAVDAAGYLTTGGLDGFDNGVELRRARLYAKGDCLMVLPVSYQLEIGYIPDEFYIEESYVQFQDLGVLGSLKLGQFQTPMGLEMVTSSRDISFMEPSAALQALAPGVNAGFELGRAVPSGRLSWRLGLFADGVGQDFGDASTDYGRAIGRITGLLWDRQDREHPEDQSYFHLGASGYALYAGEGAVRYQARPESHLAPHVIDTGDLEVDWAYVGGLEAAWVQGPLCLQAEAIHSWLTTRDGNHAGLPGIYAAASWFLTGESRPYDHQAGCFARVVPHRNLSPGDGGWGAWSVEGRYSFVDLNDRGVQGGRLSMLMSGVNWYLHSHVKWRAEYGLGHVSGRPDEGTVNIFQTRMEVDF